jgi:hypothetical protein
VTFLDRDSSLENSMHPNVAVVFGVRLARAPHPHWRAGVVRTGVEDLPHGNGDVDAFTERTSAKQERHRSRKQTKPRADADKWGPSRIWWQKNSPWRRGNDTNSTGPDADDFSLATLAELGCDPAIGLASLRADGGKVVGALGDVGGVGEVAGAGDGACKSRWG